MERSQYQEDQESRRSGRVESLSSLVLMLVLPTIDLGLASAEMGNPAAAKPAANKERAPQMSQTPEALRLNRARTLARAVAGSEDATELGYAQAA